MTHMPCRTERKKLMAILVRSLTF